MADEGAREKTGAKEVFQRSTMNRIASADELDHYIKVTNPSAWAIIIAAILLVGGILIWAIVAIVPVSVNTTGVTLENTQGVTTVVLCWVDKSTADKIEKQGAEATVSDIPAKSVAVDHTPMSLTEVVNFLGSEFYVESLKLSDWNYPVTIVPSEEPEHSDFVIGTSKGVSHLVPVSIVVLEERPITIVLGRE